MSLLLDALNRASKDRAAADAAAPSPGGTGWPNIALQILPNPPPVEQAALPPEPRPEAATSEAAPALTLASAEPAVSGLRLEPMFMEPPAQAPVAADQPLSLNPVAPASPAPKPTPTPAPISPAPAARPAEPLKVAQNMMRAKQGTLAVRPSRQRLLALGGVAGLLGLGGAVLWLGWLGPLALPGQPASPVPLASTPLVVNPAPTAAPATTVAPMVAPMVGSAAPPASAVAAASDPLAAMPAKAKKAARPAPAVAKAGRPAAVGLTSDTATSPAAVAEVATPSTRPAARARAAASAAKPADLPNLLASTPSGARALELAYAALTQGRLADAEAGYKEVLKTSPEERDALLGLAYLAHQGGRAEVAKDFYQRVLRQEPGNPSARAGLLLQNLNSDTQDLSAGAREVAGQHPASAAAQSVLGHSLVRQGRLADAQMAFQRAHALEPGVALHAFNLAVAFDRLKNYASASAIYERALSLSTQGGGAAASGLAHAVVQKRLQELGQIGSPSPPAAN